MRTPSPPSAPPTRSRSAPPNTAWDWTRYCASRAAALVGILNGVDYDEWDPRNDRHIGTHYDATHLSVKAALKQQFLTRMGLQAGPGTALAGAVTRLAAQKGIELIVGALPRLLAARDLVFVALGAGEARYEEALRDAGPGVARTRRVPPGLQRGARALDRGRQRYVSDAQPVRALRPQSDVQPALRYRARRAPHRWARRLRAALQPRHRQRHRGRVRSLHRRRAGLGPGCRA